MAILRPFLMPTAGTPQPAVLRRNMTQQDFYENQGYQQPEFTQEPITGEYLRQQLQKYAQRPAPPLLEPAARVRSANMETTNPANFQKFYEMLASINQSGNEMLGTAQAKSAFRRAQELQRIASMQPPGFTGAGQINATRKSPSSGSGGGGSIPSNPAANFRFAQSVAPNFGWGADELAAWYTLGMKESGWRNTAQNPTSTAFGIGQFLNSTWAGVGIPKTSDPALQVEAMARYIRNRYGSPSRALAFHRSHNWY